MTQENKELLLKDLCARLPYDVKCYIPRANDTSILAAVLRDGKNTLFNFWEDSRTIQDWYQLYISEFKPYLFPLSSMTDEQCEELSNLIHEHFTLDDEFSEGIRFKTYGDILVWFNEKPINECYFIFDYFNKNHFDYRGLIQKGLAIDALSKNIY